MRHPVITREDLIELAANHQPADVVTELLVRLDVTLDEIEAAS